MYKRILLIHKSKKNGSEKVLRKVRVGTGNVSQAYCLEHERGKA